MITLSLIVYLVVSIVIANIYYNPWSRNIKESILIGFAFIPVCIAIVCITATIIVLVVAVIVWIFRNMP